MSYYIIRHIRRGYFTHFIEEQAQPTFSPDELLARPFPTHGMALYEMMRWQRSMVKSTSIRQREGAYQKPQEITAPAPTTHHLYIPAGKDPPT